jgi:3-hydroxyisobutyrate dehydrogenase-like beta-hydroxyacid dehydrogenase
MQPLAIIGFGEAGRSFASAMTGDRQVRAFDIRSASRLTACAMRADYAAAGVQGCETAAEALHGAAAVLSLVTADQALPAARLYAPSLAAGAIWLDMNSVAPGTKRAAAELVGATGGRYVDAAVMAPVNPALLDVPVLLSGEHAAAGLDILQTLGFTQARVAGAAVGRAATIKLLRSVVFKGLEALTAECVLACDKAGVLDEVLGSLGADWPSLADYRLDRMMLHGVRRAAEMREAARMLQDLGIAPLMTRGTIEWQQRLGARASEPVPDGLGPKLARLAL